MPLSLLLRSLRLVALFTACITRRSVTAQMEIDVAVPKEEEAAAAGIDPGKAGCPCAAIEHVYKGYPSRYCTHTTKNGTEMAGILFNQGTDCYPFNFGSRQCLQWDTVVNAPYCDVPDPPQWCLEAWCYVDKDLCHSSNETYYKSKGWDGLYWSYSTCGGAEQSWLKKETTQVTNNITLSVSLAYIWYPSYYKKDNNSNVVENGSPAVYDQSLPWQGVLVDYFNDLVEISNMRSVRYKHRSGGSGHKNIVSKATQAISDVEAGISDAAIGTFWVTAERLEIAPFTVPIIMDTFKLWVPRTKTADTESMADNLDRLRQPFSDELWLTLFAAILTNAILSGILSPKKFRIFERKSNSMFGRMKKGALIMTDAINLSFLEFLGGGVDTAAVDPNLSQKTLNFGFALMVFVAVTAYTANLAAFLTISGAATIISSMEEATAAGMVVCAPYNIRNELVALYPSANFLFGPDNKNVQALYDEGKCAAIVQGWVDIRIDPAAQTWYCNHRLARVGPSIIEFQIGFPSTPDLVGGLSHWMANAKKQGIKFENYLERAPSTCPLEVGIVEVDEIALMTQQFSLENMVVPLIVFLICSCCAVGIHLFKLWYYRKGNREKGARHLIRTSLGWSTKHFVNARQFSTRGEMLEKSESKTCRTLDDSFSTPTRKDMCTEHNGSALSLRKMRGPGGSFYNVKSNSRLERGLSKKVESSKADSKANEAVEQFLSQQRQAMEEFLACEEEFLRNSRGPNSRGPNALWPSAIPEEGDDFSREEQEEEIIIPASQENESCV